MEAKLALRVQHAYLCVSVRRGQALWPGIPDRRRRNLPPELARPPHGAFQPHEAGEVTSVIATRFLAALGLLWAACAAAGAAPRQQPAPRSKSAAKAITLRGRIGDSRLI